MATGPPNWKKIREDYKKEQRRKESDNWFKSLTDAKPRTKEPDVQGADDPFKSAKPQKGQVQKDEIQPGSGSPYGLPQTINDTTGMNAQTVNPAQLQPGNVEAPAQYDETGQQVAQNLNQQAAQNANTQNMINAPGVTETLQAEANNFDPQKQAADKQRSFGLGPQGMDDPLAVARLEEANNRVGGDNIAAQQQAAVREARITARDEKRAADAQNPVVQARKAARQQYKENKTERKQAKLADRVSNRYNKAMDDPSPKNLNALATEINRHGGHKNGPGSPGQEQVMNMFTQGEETRRPVSLQEFSKVADGGRGKQWAHGSLKLRYKRYLGQFEEESQKPPEEQSDLFKKLSRPVKGQWTPKGGSFGANVDGELVYKPPEQENGGRVASSGFNPLQPRTW